MEALRVYRGLFANRPLTKLLVGEFITGIGDWLYIVAIFIVIYRESQDAALVGANGYLNAAIGVGGLAGAVGAGVLVLRRGLGAPLIVGAQIGGAGLAILGAVPILSVALLAIAVSSAGFLVVDVVMTRIFQRLVPDELRGRGIGVLMAVSTLAAAAGAFSLPVLVVSLGAAPSLGA